MKKCGRRKLQLSLFILTLLLLLLLLLLPLALFSQTFTTGKQKGKSWGSFPSKSQENEEEGLIG